MIAMIARFLQAQDLETERRVTIRNLLALDDRTLDDIGYTRGALESALSDPEEMSFTEIRKRSKRDLTVQASRPARLRQAGAVTPKLENARLCSTC